MVQVPDSDSWTEWPQWQRGGCERCEQQSQNSANGSVRTTWDRRGGKMTPKTRFWVTSQRSVLCTETEGGRWVDFELVGLKAFMEYFKKILTGSQAMWTGILREKHGLVMWIREPLRRHESWSGNSGRGKEDDEQEESGGRGETGRHLKGEIGNNMKGPHFAREEEKPGLAEPKEATRKGNPYFSPTEKQLRKSGSPSVVNTIWSSKTPHTEK